MQKIDLTKTTTIKFWLLLQVALILSKIAIAQDGVAGIKQATELMKKYFEAGISLLYIIGAVMGLVGAIKVYNKWSSGDPNTNAFAAAWFGACIFLVIVTTALKSFFGV